LGDTPGFRGCKVFQWQFRKSIAGVVRLRALHPSSEAAGDPGFCASLTMTALLLMMTFDLGKGFVVGGGFDCTAYKR
jgi:hypothetical protein